MREIEFLEQMINFEKEILNLRKEYTQNVLDEKSVIKNPFKQFEVWFQEVLRSKIDEANAMTLSTATKNGTPSSRIVLLKKFDESGFIFFTNYKSQKGVEIFENPNVSLLFFWKELERQIRISGITKQISKIESFKYFTTRPTESKIGAWISNQSKVIETRKFLEIAFEKMKLDFRNKKIPLPPNWGGIKVIPNKFEFWQGRKNRLHDRILYSLQENKIWKIERLMP